MYSEFFSLRCEPFEDRVDTQFLFLTPGREKTLAAMEYQSRCGKGIMLITAEAGAGKTMLIRALLQKLHGSDRAVVVNWPREGKFNLVRETCKRFGVTLPRLFSRRRGLAKLRRGLSRLYKTGHRAILVIDQAEHMEPEDLLELPAMTGFQKGGDRLLTVILVSRPEIRSKLDAADSSELRRHLRSERELKPLTFEESNQYIQHRLHIAGAADPDLFDVDATSILHEASGGLPRALNRLCQTAMMVAHGINEKRIDHDIAVTVADESLPPARSVDLKEIGIDAISDVSRKTRATRVTGEETRADAVQAPAAPMPEAEGTRAPTDAALAARMEGLMAQGEELARRLERMLARADRTSDTSEAALLQSTAVEKHLASLTDDADTVITQSGRVGRAGG